MQGLSIFLLYPIAAPVIADNSHDIGDLMLIAEVSILIFVLGVPLQSLVLRVHKNPKENKVLRVSKDLPVKVFNLGI